ncbi:MAG: FAD-dependent oxidoreductase [Akkermansia sp.]
MMKYAVIGAGVSGLSMAGMLLKKGHEVVVYERDSRPGGLIKCTEVQGNLYHRVGGHVFNSRRQEVLDWFWSRFDKERDFVSARRRAVISLEGGAVVDYPIENHLDQFPRPSVPPSSMNCWSFTGIPLRNPVPWENFSGTVSGRP